MRSTHLDRATSAHEPLTTPAPPAARPRATRPRAARRLAIGAALGALALVGVSACASSVGTPNTAQRFTANVTAAGQGGGTLAMTDVTHFNWNHGVLACPADPVAAVESALGARWADAPSAVDDGAAYVLFADGDAVVDSITLDRAVIDPCAGDPLLAARTFGPTAVFHVSKSASGNAWTLGPKG